MIKEGRRQYQQKVTPIIVLNSKTVKRIDRFVCMCQSPYRIGEFESHVTVMIATMAAHRTGAIAC